MNKEKLRYYHKLLQAEKQRLEQGLKKFSSERELSIKESTQELSSYDNHPADEASNTFGRELDLGIRDNTVTLYLKVQDALTKIEAGNYGICQECGKEIAAERLEVMPATSFCEECQKHQEELVGSRERPKAEEFLYPPFGRGFNDGTDKVEYDAEDTWQDVAQYGSSDSPQDVPETLMADGNPRYRAFTDANEIVGAVGIEDSIFDDEADDQEEISKMKTSFTGKLGEDRR